MATVITKAFDTFIERARNTEEPAVLWYAFLDYFHTHQIPMVSYHHNAQPGAHGEDRTRVVTDGFPEDWVCHYIEKRLYLIDPIPELAAQSATPFFWHDVTKFKKLIACQEAYLRELDESGLGEGVAVQVFGPNLRNGYVGLGFGGERRDIGDGMLTEFQMVGQVGHLRYCELVPVEAPQEMPLSNREREILEWIARGKSNSAIGGILGLSAHTVDAYVRRIFAKLGVADRITAAIRGIGSGLVKGSV